jgi:hypothetical protein
MYDLTVKSEALEHTFVLGQSGVLAGQGDGRRRESSSGRLAEHGESGCAGRRVDYFPFFLFVPFFRGLAECDLAGCGVVLLRGCAGGLVGLC